MTGEERHERCRHGTLTPSWQVDMGGRESPGGALPLCLWRAPDPHPPAVDRAWGGLVEFDRDCAVCKAYDPL